MSGDDLSSPFREHLHAAGGKHPPDHHKPASPWYLWLVMISTSACVYCVIAEVLGEDGTDPGPETRNCKGHFCFIIEIFFRREQICVPGGIFRRGF